MTQPETPTRTITAQSLVDLDSRMKELARTVSSNVRCAGAVLDVITVDYPLSCENLLDLHISDLVAVRQLIRWYQDHFIASL